MVIWDLISLFLFATLVTVTCVYAIRAHAFCTHMAIGRTGIISWNFLLAQKQFKLTYNTDHIQYKEENKYDYLPTEEQEFIHTAIVRPRREMVFHRKAIFGSFFISFFFLKRWNFFSRIFNNFIFNLNTYFYA